MPLLSAYDFIQTKSGGTELANARRQQEELSYFTESNIQEEINYEYINQWAERKWVNDDVFLNFVKAVFRTENAMTFYKYLRFPVPSAHIVNDKLKDQLQRVFFAEDAFFKYQVNGQSVETPEQLDIKKFNKLIFNALLFRHNDILFHDLRDINEPYRHLIPITRVVAIESKNSVIKQICFTAVVEIEEKPVKGFLYADAENYMFFDDKLKEEPLFVIPHDLGQCPADYISAEPFSSDNDIVRKSVFSYVKPVMEEYCFLKTLQRMTDPNGVIPITTEVEAKIQKRDGVDTDGPHGHPMNIKEIGGQRSEIGSEVIGANKDNPLSTGTRISIPPEAIREQDGRINMDLVKHWINFHHLPVEPMEYIKTRIFELEQQINIAVTGGFTAFNKEAKNEFQIKQELNNEQDKLRDISLQLTRIRNRSDYKMLALELGPDRVEVDCFYGSDFFIESPAFLYEQFKNAPNPIERRALLIRISQMRFMFNESKKLHDRITYSLLPYVSDDDFDKAIAREIDDVLFEYQNRFNYWINTFEAEYGDLVFFWTEVLEGTNSQKLQRINNLIIQIIQNDRSQRSA